MVSTRFLIRHLHRRPFAGHWGRQRIPAHPFLRTAVKKAGLSVDWERGYNLGGCRVLSLCGMERAILSLQVKIGSPLHRVV
jgi:hypothetical protein